MKKMNIGFLGIVLVIFVVMASGCTSSDSNSTAPGMSASQVKSNATLVTSDNLERNAGNMTGKAIKITGKVFDIHSAQFLMFTKQSYGVWMEGTCYVNVKGTMPSNIINDDIVTVYAVVDGKKDYATAAGGSNLVPELTVYPENIVLNTKS